MTRLLALPGHGKRPPAVRMLLMLRALCKESLTDQQIARRYGVSVKTAARDVEALRRVGIPVVAGGYGQGWRVDAKAVAKWLGVDDA